eukprot:gene2996-13010_t
MRLRAACPPPDFWQFGTKGLGLAHVNGRLLVLAPQLLSGHQPSQAVVVGGTVLDIQAAPSKEDVQSGTTVPGHVRQIPGGVARNIAEGLSRLLPNTQPPPFFISCVGDDAAGTLLMSELRKLRLETEGVVVAEGATTACVAVVLDRAGEVAAAVADVACVEEVLTPSCLQQFSARIQSAAVLVAETNLHPDALASVCTCASGAGVPIFLEPVSVVKALRCLPVLHHLTFIKPNTAELTAMADAICTKLGRPVLPRPTSWTGGSPAAPLEDLAKLSFMLLKQGSHGAALMTLPDPQGSAVQVLHMKALPANVVSLTGAGDSLVSGSVAALLNGQPPIKALAYGMAAARHAVQCSQNVPLGLSLGLLDKDATQAHSSLTNYTFNMGP